MSSDPSQASPSTGEQPEPHSQPHKQINSHFKGSHPNAVHSSSPFPFLNPTTRYHPIALKSAPQKQNDPTTTTTPTKTYHIWRSRDNRKGRHAVIVVRERERDDAKGARARVREGEGGDILTPNATNTLTETFKGLVKMLVRWPVWDVSFDVAVVFTFG